MTWLMIVCAVLNVFVFFVTKDPTQLAVAAVCFLAGLISAAVEPPTDDDF